jgi:flagellar motor component MotA
MDMTMTIAFVLIGLAAIAAGLLASGCRPAIRLAAGLALVVGAGVGVVAIALGTQMVEDSPESYERVFLTASAPGSLATVASLAVLWRGVARERRP